MAGGNAQLPDTPRNRPAQQPAACALAQPHRWQNSPWVMSLAGLFNNAVDSYGYVRLGQHYAPDFETSQTKLDLSKLQLSCWGAALGLDAFPTKASSLPVSSVPQHEVQQAEAALRQITDLLDDASARRLPW